MDGVEDGQVVGVALAALAGGDAADHFGAVLEAIAGVEGARFAGDALADHAGFLVDEDAHGVRRPFGLVRARLPACLWARGGQDYTATVDVAR